MDCLGGMLVRTRQPAMLTYLRLKRDSVRGPVASPQGEFTRPTQNLHAKDQLGCLCASPDGRRLRLLAMRSAVTGASRRSRHR